MLVHLGAHTRQRPTAQPASGPLIRGYNTRHETRARGTGALVATDGSVELMAPAAQSALAHR
jgi:hypothetical protein